jgi:hypothetical protein
LAAVNVEHLGAGPHPILDVGSVTDGDDATVRHGQCLSGGSEFVDGEKRFRK